MAVLHRVFARLLALVMVTSGLALGLTAAPASASQTPAPAPTESSPPDKSDTPIRGLDAELDVDATISGLVYDENGELIDNISVQAFSALDPGGEPVASDLTYEDGNSASHGAYRLHVPAGDYLVRFSSPEFAGRVYETVFYGGGTGDTVTVAAAEDVSLDDVSMVRDTGAAVSGVVRDAAGQPMAGIEVTLIRDYGDGWAWGIDYTSTDAQGRYTFEGVDRRGTYTVRAHGRWNEDGDWLGLVDTYLGQAPTVEIAQTFTVPTGVASHEISTPVVLTAGTTVSGRVTGPNGEVVDEAEIYFYAVAPDGSRGYSTYSYTYDAAGAYSANLLPGYSYTVGAYAYGEFWTGYEVYLGNGSDLETADTFVLGEQPVALADIGIGAETTLVSVRLEDQNGELLSADDVNLDVYVTEVVDGSWGELNLWVRESSAGTYDIRLPYDADYTFYAEDWNTGGMHFLGGGQTIAEAETVRPIAGQPSLDAGAIVVSVPQAVVKGRVMEGGQPVASSEVQLVAPLGDGGYESLRWAEVRADGTFRLRVPEWVTPEQYPALTVAAYSDFDDHEVTYLGSVTDIASANTFAPPAAGTVENVGDIELQLADGLVRGRVTLPTGDTMGGDDEYDIDLYRWVEEDWDSDGVPDESYFEYYNGTWTGGWADGRYSFRYVEPGTYTVRVEHYDWNNEDEPYVVSWLGGGTTRPQEPGESSSFEVLPDAVSTDGVDVEMLRGVQLTGQVSSEGGLPLGDAWIYLYQWVDGVPQQMGNTSTRSDGSYAVAVPPNTDLWISTWRSGFDEFNLGGEDWPNSQTPENTLSIGTEPATFDIQMTADWGLVGAVAGDQQDYCLANYSSYVEFAGQWFFLNWDGQLEGEDGFDPRFAWWDEQSRDPALAPLSDTWSSDWRTWGISPDGSTLCVQWNSDTYDDGSGQSAYSPVYQLLMTENPAGGFDVTYNYDTVPSVEVGAKAGHSSGDGAPVLFPVAEGGSYADSDITNGLIHNSLGSTQPGRYQFHFDGFDRGDAPWPIDGAAIDGEPVEGSTLTANPGAWALDDVVNQDVELTYVWERGRRWNPKILGTGPTYEVKPEDAGRRVRLMVRGWAPGRDYTYDRARVDIAVGPRVATVTTEPSLSSTTPKVGDALTVDPGTWTPADGLQPEDIAVSYRWQRNGRWISGEIGDTYVAQPGDELDTIRAEVTLSAPEFSDVATMSDTATVADRAPVVQTTAPSLSGTPKVGETLTLDPGTWTADGQPVAISYKWKAGSLTRTPEGDGSTYTLQAKDKGLLVTATVTASAPDHKSVSWSQTVGPVAAADASLGTMRLTVVDDETEDPVEGAWVSACEYDTWTCLPGSRTDADGKFSGTALSGTTYWVSVWTDGVYRTLDTEFDMPAASGELVETVGLVRPTPPPANVEVPSSIGEHEGMPTVTTGTPLQIQVRGCAIVDSPTYTVTFGDGTTRTGSLTRTLDGDGLAVYSASISLSSVPAFGETLISTNVPADCEPGTEPTEFPVYIDPSGIVTDQYGTPLEGAEVTLQRADTVAGPFTQVPDGDETVMDPAINVANPSSTDETGYFRWDVVEGWYRVKAAYPSCTTRVTNPMQVPPERVDLVIKLQCTATPPAATPAVTGVAQVGNQLTTDTSVWPEDFTVATQWLRDGQAISGATGSSYTLTAADRGADVSVRHVAQRATRVQEHGRGEPVEFDPATAVSAPVTVVAADAPVATEAPAVSGSGKVGSALTVSDPVWSVPGVAVTRQWLRDGSPIAGATGASYDVVPGDVGKAFTVRFAATKAGFADGSAVSNTVTAVKGDAPTATAGTISGTRKVGTELSVTAPAWSLPGVTTTVAWLRDGQVIGGATGLTYEVVPGDVGKQISARFTGSKPGYTDGTATTAAVTAIESDAPVATKAPAVSGTGKVGSALTVSDPTWSVPGVTVSRQWLRDGSPIAGATGASYDVVPGDVGKVFSVRFTATKAGHSDGSAVSNTVTAVKGDAAKATALPVIGGTPRVGQTLTVQPGTWDASGLTFAYQWLRNGSPITGATTSSYALTGADAVSTIGLVVTASRAGYADGTAKAAEVSVPKAASKTAIKAKKKWPAKKNAKVTIRVTASGIAGPTGKVILKDGKKKVAVVTLQADQGGVAKVKLGKLKKGKHVFTAKYKGSADTAGSKSKKFTMKVV